VRYRIVPIDEGMVEEILPCDYITAGTTQMTGAVSFFKGISSGIVRFRLEFYGEGQDINGDGEKA
jgi:hypothetical protein